MPIEITPTNDQIVVTQEQTVQCDSMYIDSLNINGGSHDGTTSPSATIQSTRYKSGTPNQFANTQLNFGTSDLFAASVNIPEIGQAIQAVYVAVAAWYAYNQARQADVETANEAVTSAQTAEQAALQTSLAKAADRNTANAAALAAAASGDQAAIDAANAALTAADLAVQEAATAYADAQQATITAKANAQKALAALNDPANPKLQLQPATKKSVSHNKRK